MCFQMIYKLQNNYYVSLQWMQTKIQAKTCVKQSMGCVSKAGHWQRPLAVC